MRIRRFYITATAFLLSISMQGFCQEVALDWAKQFGGTKSVYVNKMALDHAGNILLTGYFEETIDFDPGPGTFNLTSGGKTDIFVAKLDAAGEFIWAKHFSGTGNDRGYSLAVDTGSNVYVTGGFEETADFDPGPGTQNLSASASESIFISKLDPNGNLSWVKQFQSSAARHVGTSIVIDSEGDILIAGYFTGPTDLDPGPGTFMVTSSGTNYGFICKLKPDGGFIWGSQYGGDAFFNITEIAVDPSNNILSIGHYDGTADVDPGTGTFSLTAVGSSDLFVMKTTSSGTLEWAKSAGGEYGDYAKGIAVDQAGNIFITGYFYGTADFDPGIGVFNLTSTRNNIHVSKLNAAGGFEWAKMFTGSSTDYGKSIAVDLQGRIYVTGCFTGITDFDPGPAVNSLTSKGETDFYICKLDSDGSLVRINQLAGSSYECANSIMVDPNGTIYAAGYFAGSPDFDPGNTNNILTAKGATDSFIVKLSQETSGLADNRLAVNCVAFPNPTVGPVTINAEGVSGQPSIRVYSMHGILIREIRHPGGNRIDLDLTEEANGLYVIEISDFKTLSRLKVLKY